MSATEATEAAERPAAGQPAAGAVHHARPFKLRFAAQREPGRSYVSLVKPRELPATVTDKFYARGPRQAGAAEAEAERRALTRITAMFAAGPRETLPAPLTESHVYGWWSPRGAQAREDARLSHHIRDFAWLKGRMLVLAEDYKLRHH